MKLTYDFLKKEICKRDDAKGTGYDLRANHVSACLGHLLDIFAEEEVKYWESEGGSRFVGPTAMFLDKHVSQRIKAIRKAQVDNFLAGFSDDDIKQLREEEGIRWETSEEKAVREARKSKRPDKKGSNP